MDLMLILLLIMVVFMVFTFRRGKKMRDEQQAARNGATVGAEVVTAGGLVGTVVARDEEKQRLTLEFSTGDQADFLIGAVQQVMVPGEAAEEAPDDVASIDAETAAEESKDNPAEVEAEVVASEDSATNNSAIKDEK